MEKATYLLLLISMTMLSSCKSDNHQYLLFSKVNSNITNIKFTNHILESDSVNYFSYPYLYMGGGVAINDINNDGLPDIYFTSNMGENKLYLNKGNFVFEDITISAGVTGDKRWYTGVTIVDINGDNLQDIYLSVSGKWTTTRNQLFINKGDLTFTEEAEKYGLNDIGQSTQSTFFDYDNDGDLDVYVANYPFLDFKAPYFVYSQNIKNPKHYTSDHFYRNDSNTYVDVTAESGLLNYGLTLSATPSDLNKDGYTDIYVSNDFASPDHLYLNNQDGTFREVIKDATNHTSFYGMGSDIADLNNDGLYDVFQVDMTPADNFRSKANMASMNIEGFHTMINQGLHYQYMENTFHLNHGIDANGIPHFGDISRLTGTALTDWSWSALTADFDNNGHKDIHVTNGTKRDINNKDYFNQLEKDKKYSKLTDYQKTLQIPSQGVANYAFANYGELEFSDKSEEWGLADIGFSNGAAYGDLDNDGDLDLVVNNIDSKAYVYRNNSANNWIKLKCSGPSGNTRGLGADIQITDNHGLTQTAQLHTTRGFQSSSESIIHFGIGTADTIDQLVITWPNGYKQQLNNILANQTIELNYHNAKSEVNKLQPIKKRFTLADLKVNYKHEENNIEDFQKEVLLPHATSAYGPGLAVGDLNKDGLDDIYICGAKNQTGRLLLQNKTGQLIESKNGYFSSQSMTEDYEALIFDADNDGWNDLYVVSGGSEWPLNDEAYQDKFYHNKKGKLHLSKAALPLMTQSGSRVKACDYDNDGDLDLLVGGRLIPQAYGQKAKTTLLRNDSKQSKIKFTDITDTAAPILKEIGMVTDFVWVDFNNDNMEDIVITGEWMPITFLQNMGNTFKNVTSEYGHEDKTGWWFSISTADLNDDGQPDFVAGNLGKNYKYQASDKEPFELYIDDYDKNGEQDIVLGYYEDGELYPLRGKQCSAEQIPEIKNKYPTYNDYAAATLSDIYGHEALSASKLKLKATTFASSILLSNQSGKYQLNPLPNKAQISSINKTIIKDFNNDDVLDILTIGNLFQSEVETKRNDASAGCYLKGLPNDTYKAMSYEESGFYAGKNSRDMEILKIDQSSFIVITNNNDSLDIIKLN